MFCLLGNERIDAVSTGSLSPEEIVHDRVRGQPDINMIATRKQNEVDILIWNYHDDDLPAPEATIDLSVSGLPKKTERALLEHFRIDSDHSNAFTLWKKMGSPQSPTSEQYQELQRAGQL